MSVSAVRHRRARPTRLVVLSLREASRLVLDEGGRNAWIRQWEALLEGLGEVVELEGGTVKVCYSRPRKLGRPVMGRLVPYGEPWRLGANEATAIHVPFRAKMVVSWERTRVRVPVVMRLRP